MFLCFYVFSPQTCPGPDWDYRDSGDTKDTEGYSFFFKESV